MFDFSKSGLKSKSGVLAIAFAAIALSLVPPATAAQLGSLESNPAITSQPTNLQDGTLIARRRCRKVRIPRKIVSRKKCPCRFRGRRVGRGFTLIRFIPARTVTRCS